MKKPVVVLAMLPLVLFAASPKLRLGYYGHSMFEIVLPSGVRIITDPFDLTTGPAFPTGVKAEIVVMSHNHFDHDYSAGIGGSPSLISWASGSAHGINFTATPTKHFPDGPEGENHMMTWEAAGIKFNHIGDYGDTLSPADSTVLAASMFLFIPVGGAFTIDAAQANDIINHVKPIVALPMHYKTPDHSAGFSSLATIEQANASFTVPIVTKMPWIAVDPDELPTGPVIWEPDYSAELPGDLEAKGISVSSNPPYTVGITVKNNAPRNADNAQLILTVYDSTALVQADTALISMPAGKDSEFTFPLTPPGTGEYTLVGEAIFPADEVPPNDTVSTKVNLVGITETKTALRPTLSAHWLADGILFIEYASAGTKAELCLYDAQGRLVNRFGLNKTPTGVIRWLPEKPLAQGCYFLKMSTARGPLTQKLVLVHSAIR
jgi:L-ascorbate metabolism protein UlaG (beta-lactamase superfamily)